MNVSLDIKTSNPGGFTGYGSVFYTIDRAADIIVPGAFAAGLDDLLKSGFMGGVGHNHGAPAGKFTVAREDDRGLYVEGTFSDVTAGHEARTLIKDGVVKKLSVGIDKEDMQSHIATVDDVRAMWEKAGYVPTPADMRRLGMFRKFRIITKATVREISPVTIPANDLASILSVKNGEPLPAEFSLFINTGRAAMVKLATVNTKAGRVLSGKNEQKLRAMLEVLTSVTDELNLLLEAVVQASPLTEDGEPDDDDGEQDKATDTREKEQDSEFEAERGKAAKKSLDRARLQLAMSL